MCSVQNTEDGFSLVEILVALFIMALASAMIVMAIPAGRDPLEAEASRFEAVLARAADQSISRGQAHGVWFGENSYRLYARIGGRWVPVRGAEAVLPDGMTLMSTTRRGEAETDRPQIVADAAGIISGPAVRISKGGRYLDVRPMEAVGADE